MSFRENCGENRYVDVDEISPYFLNFSSYLYKIRHRRCTKFYWFTMNYVKVATLTAILLIRGRNECLYIRCTYLLFECVVGKRRSILRRVKERGISFVQQKGRKANWVGRILRRFCLVVQNDIESRWQAFGSSCHLVTWRSLVGSSVSPLWGIQEMNKDVELMNGACLGPFVLVVLLPGYTRTWS